MCVFCEIMSRGSISGLISGSIIRRESPDTNQTMSIRNSISPKDAAKAAYDEAVSFVKGYPSFSPITESIPQ